MRRGQGEEEGLHLRFSSSWQEVDVRLEGLSLFPHFSLACS
jgi:hypothetical protein